MTARPRLAAACCLLALVACSADVHLPADAEDAGIGASPPAADAPTLSAAAADAGVHGTIRGTEVTLGHAAFDGQLAISEGDGWGSSPSLLIFFFDEEEIELEGRSLAVEPKSWEMGMPHVHYRWRDPESGDLASRAVMEGYALELTMGAREDDRLHGRIAFSIPGEDTAVAGSFVAVVEEP